jgi:transposase
MCGECLMKNQAAKVDMFKAVSVDFAAMRALAMRFWGIRHSVDVQKLTVWRHDADRSGFYGIRRFVRTLRQDLAAVCNAITATWSSGQTGVRSTG